MERGLAGYQVADLLHISWSEQGEMSVAKGQESIEEWFGEVHLEMLSMGGAINTTTQNYTNSPS